ncbi:MAG TPA: hypothetical protein EYP77_09570, partial [Anaerolineae bacterium]|nr:hypothetical protein [Anaerolineae bacterium]
MHRTWFFGWVIASILFNMLIPVGVGTAGPSAEAASSYQQLLPAWFTEPARPQPNLAARASLELSKPPAVVQLDRRARLAAPPASLPETPASQAVFPSWYSPAVPDAGRSSFDSSRPSSLLPEWYTASAPGSDPSSFVVGRSSPNVGRPSTLLPAWFTARNPRPTTSNEQPATRNHHTIHPNAVTVSGPSTSVNNCDPVTFTVVATNDAVTTTGVIITSAMPTGFVPMQQVFNVGTVGPNETITRHAVFSATCNAVSGQNVTTLSQDGYGDITIYTDFVV